MTCLHFVSSWTNCRPSWNLIWIFVTEQTNPKLVANIERDGVILMDKMQEKYEKLVQAVHRLDEAIVDYDQMGLDSIRDGVIQRF